MSAILERQGPNRRIDSVIIWLVTATLAAFGGGAFLGFILAKPSSGERIACDRALEAVITSRDAIEIERGAVLISALGCDVRRSIGQDGHFRPRAEAQ